MHIEKAVERAVNECIEDDILKEFLAHQKSEVVKMSIYEFDQELHNRTLKDEGFQYGKEEGIAVGREAAHYQIALKMYQKGMDVSFIADTLDEDIGQIEKWLGLTLA